MIVSPVRFAVFSAATCALIGLASCSQDGVTSNCPALPLYETFALGDAAPPDAGSADSAATEQALEKAYAANCATRPGPSVASASSSAGTSSGGNAGTSGGGGSAGHAAGGASAGGSTNTENAGAAGSN